MTEKNILIAGVGNPYRGDDGIGVIVIQQLQQQPSLLPYAADFLDAGTDGLALLDIIPQYKHAIIIDAVNMRAAPGTIKIFAPEEAKINITHDALSTHGFGLAEMLQLAEQLGITATTKITIIGIEPKTLEFGSELSTEAQQAIPQIIEAIELMHAL